VVFDQAAVAVKVPVPGASPSFLMRRTWPALGPLVGMAYTQREKLVSRSLSFRSSSTS
jgi:hypothetical protein